MENYPLDAHKKHARPPDPARGGSTTCRRNVNRSATCGTKNSALESDIGREEQFGVVDSRNDCVWRRCIGMLRHTALEFIGQLVYTDALSQFW